MLAMESMKSSRRKQTKPIRVPFGVDPDTGALDATITVAPPSVEEEHNHSRGCAEEHNRNMAFLEEHNRSMGFSEEHNRNRSFLEEHSCNRGFSERHHNQECTEEQNRGYERCEENDGPLDMHVSVIACKMCLETFSSHDDLLDHMEGAHCSLPKRPRLSLESDFPTAYHRLGSELFQENAFVTNGHTESQSEVLSLMKPKPDCESKDQACRDQNGEISVKVDGGKIFHQDAYCELCDREFCNKYFLKTHKANKHGIFDNSSPSPYSGAPPTSSNTPVIPEVPMGVFEVNLTASSPNKTELSHTPWQQVSKNENSGKQDQQQLLQQQQQQQQQNQQNQHRQQLPPTEKKAETETDKKVSSLISAVMNSVHNSSSSSSENKPPSSSTNSTSGSGPSSKDPAMEDYCEICQKRFCNKYYLKKHKQDVHGIIPETGPTTTTKRSRASSSLLDLPVVSCVGMGSPMLFPQPVVSMGGMPALPPGVMFLNPILQQMTIIPTGSLSQPLFNGHQLHPPPQSPIISQPHSMPNLPGPSPTPPVSSNSHMHSRASPMGVVNPDAFCGICHKEFANRYFLKIHNANKHGLHCEDIPPEAKMLGDMVETKGIVVPMFHSAKELKQEFHANANRSSPPPLTSISHMVTCRQCDKDFPNAHAYKLHQAAEHGKGLEASLTDGHENNLPKSEPSATGSGTESLLRMAADASAVSHATAAVSAGSMSTNSNSASPGGTTMFGNMVAAKLADRVTCDICNKELCNKYFLKSHKLKMHGVEVDREADKGQISPGKNPQQPSPNSKPQPLNMSLGIKSPLSLMPKLDFREFQDYGKDFRDFKLMKDFSPFKNFSDVPAFLHDTVSNDFFRRSQPPFKGLDFTHPGIPQGPVECPPAEELVKMGIDPEAYCEICKKEFCSKYFLRTHRLNIHGIKTDVPETDRTRAKPSKPLPSNKPNHNNNNNSNNNNNNHHHHHHHNQLNFGNIVGLPFPGMGMGFGGISSAGFNGSPLNAVVGSSSGGAVINRGKDSFEKHTWRWKEPVNSARVTCEICNKEVCNRYFLRTHKLNKHGIIPSDKSLSPSMNGSPVPSDIDASSNTSSQPDNYVTDKINGTEGQSASHSIPFQSSEKSKVTGFSKQNFEDEKECAPPKYNNCNSSNLATCHLCERQFKNTHWLTAHLVKDHAEYCDDEAVDMRMLPPMEKTTQQGRSVEAKTCHTCHVDFSNELSLQMHLIQEHSSQVMHHMDDENLQQKKTVCDLSPLQEPKDRKIPLQVARSVRSNFRSKVRTHFVSKRQKLYVCSICDYKTIWHSNLVSHEEEMHNIVSQEKRAFACKLCPSFSSMCSHGSQVEAQHFVSPHNAYLDLSSNTPPALHTPPAQHTTNLKMFKCCMCTSRFATLSFCLLHLREVHIHMLKDFASHKCAQPVGKIGCTLCSFSTRFPSRLSRHIATAHHHIMSGVYQNSVQDDSDVKDESSERKSMGTKETLFRPSLGKVEASLREESATQCLLQQTFQLGVSRCEAGYPSQVNNFVSPISTKPARQKMHEPLAMSFLLTPITP